MDISTILCIAVALAMDAFSVSIASGAILQNMSVKDALKLSFFFGLFQGVMPIIGWFSGAHMVSYFSLYAKWIAFFLLMFVGLKMIYEAVHLEEYEKDSLKFKTLILLSIATSIDALVVGFSFVCLDVSLIIPAIVIGVITFVFCLVGTYIGRIFGHLFENKIEIFGGIMIIIIALKILFYN